MSQVQTMDVSGLIGRKASVHTIRYQESSELTWHDAHIVGAYINSADALIVLAVLDADNPGHIREISLGSVKIFRGI